MWKPLFVSLLVSRFSLKMYQNSNQNGRLKKHRKMMPLGTQNHPKMHQSSMFSPPKTPNCANKVILGRIVFLAIFWVAIFPVFGKIWCQNGVSGKKNFRTFWSILEFKTPFWRSPPFFPMFLAKISIIHQNPIRINRKSHKILFKFHWKSYARLTNLPKGSYPPLPH